MIRAKSLGQSVLRVAGGKKRHSEAPQTEGTLAKKQDLVEGRLTELIDALVLEL